MHQAVRQGTDKFPVSAHARVGLGGAIVFVGSTVIMHLAQPELNPVDDAVSYYMNGRLGWIMGLGLMALGIGSLGLAEGLRRLPPTRQTRAGWRLLSVWGIGAVIGGIFPPDPIGSWDQPPSLAGMIHSGAAMMAFLAFPISAVLLSRAIAQAPALFGRTDHLSVLALLGAVALVIFFMCLAPVFANQPPYVLGLVERVLLVLIVGWLSAVGLSMRRMASRT